MKGVKHFTEKTEQLRHGPNPMDLPQEVVPHRRCQYCDNPSLIRKSDDPLKMSWNMRWYFFGRKLSRNYIGHDTSRNAFDPDWLIWCLSKTARKCTKFYQIIKAFGRMVRGTVQEAHLSSLLLVVKRDCNETPMLGIRIVLSFLFLLGLVYHMEIPSQAVYWP